MRMCWVEIDLTPQVSIKRKRLAFVIHMSTQALCACGNKTLPLANDFVVYHMELTAGNSGSRLCTL